MVPLKREVQYLFFGSVGNNKNGAKRWENSILHCTLMELIIYLMVIYDGFKPNKFWECVQVSPLHPSTKNWSPIDLKVFLGMYAGFESSIKYNPV